MLKGVERAYPTLVRLDPSLLIWFVIRFYYREPNRLRSGPSGLVDFEKRRISTEAAVFNRTVYVGMYPRGETKYIPHVAVVKRFGFHAAL
jgi:hypothetical protein